MGVTNYDIRQKCAGPGCNQYATRKVNLTCFADYMAKLVCEAHVKWAENHLEQFVPDP